VRKILEEDMPIQRIFVMYLNINDKSLKTVAKAEYAETTIKSSK
jgi:hypothetical protein